TRRRESSGSRAATWTARAWSSTPSSDSRLSWREPTKSPRRAATRSPGLSLRRPRFARDESEAFRLRLLRERVEAIPVRPVSPPRAGLDPAERQPGLKLRRDQPSLPRPGGRGLERARRAGSISRRRADPGRRDLVLPLDRVVLSGGQEAARRIERA